MKIEDYFYDSSLVTLEFNGETNSLEKYTKIINKNKFKMLNRETVKYIDIKLMYANELAGSIEGYILDFNESHKYLEEDILEEYIEDIYWDLDSKWEDLGTFFKTIIDNDYSLKKIYFIIKDMKVVSEFKNDGVEKFFINEIREIIKNYTYIDVDYLIVMNDTSKFELANEKFNLKVGEKLKFSFFKNMKKVNYFGKERKIENIINIAQKNNFEFLYTKDKNIKLWIK